METNYNDNFLKKLTAMCGIDKGKYFYATIGGNIFKSETGKIIFQRKGPLMISLNHRLQFRVSTRVYKKLTDKGYSPQQIHNDREYQDAWKNFLSWAIETKFIQIKEIELK